MDFLRTISPFIYVLLPILIFLFIAYKITMKNLSEDQKEGPKKFFKYVLFGVLLIFSIAVLRMAMINETPRNDVDHSIKKERSDYAIEKSKQDTINKN